MCWRRRIRSSCSSPATASRSTLLSWSLDSVFDSSGSPKSGPFRGYPTENPSTLTARHLDGLVLDVPPSASPDEAPKRRRRRVEVTFRSLAVTYEEVDSIIPPLHEQGIYDAFIHVGVASRARDGLRLEQRGRKGMYNSVDSESQHCQPDNEGKRTVPDWKAQEDEMWSTLDLPALLAWLRDDMGIEVRCLGDDKAAGHD